MEQTPDIKTNGNRILDLIYKVYGGIDLTWPKVIVLSTIDFVITDGDTETWYSIDILDDDGTADIVITENGDDEDGN